MKREVIVLALCLLAGTAPAAPRETAEEKNFKAKLKNFEESLNWRQGSVELPGGFAKLEVPKGFRYLPAADAERVLKIWGNENVGETLGMVFPSDLSPFCEEGWGAVISYHADGYVSDVDAKSLDYAKLLSEMQQSLHEANEADKTQPQGKLLGWATEPKYDAATHKMYWAKEIRYSDNPQHALNYEMRVLGKGGVLVMNVVATMPQLKMLERQAPKLLALVEFMPGHRYADYKAGADKKAHYHLAGLVAGDAAGKSAFLKGEQLYFEILVALALLGCIGLFSSKSRSRKKTDGNKDSYDKAA